jgi:hypothetical protein
MEEWLAIYRDTSSWTTEELQTEITRLKDQIRNPFQSMQAGQRGHTRVSIFDLRQQLLGAQTALRERGGTGDGDTGHWVADFSDVQP